MSISFTLGEPPKNALLASDSRWLIIPGYNQSVQVALRAIGIGLITAAVLAIAWRVLVPTGLPLEARPAISSVLFVFLIATLGHELCHLVAFPNCGLRNSVVGVWPKMGSVFVQYLRPVKRWRFIVAALFPALVICFLPLMLGILGFQVPAFIQWASVLNGVGIGADLLAVTVLLRHTAATDLILESNHALYRRDEAGKPIA